MLNFANGRKFDVILLIYFQIHYISMLMLLVGNSKLKNYFLFCNKTDLYIIPFVYHMI